MKTQHQIAEETHALIRRAIARQSAEKARRVQDAVRAKIALGGDPYLTPEEHADAVRGWSA